MNSITLFLFFIPILGLILLGINLVFAPHNAYQEKSSTFECGFHSFLGQNRTQFSISFFVFALLFLIFDLELVLALPGIISMSTIAIYGISIMIIFFTVLTVGFVFELGKKALNIDSRQYDKPLETSHYTTFKLLITYSTAKIKNLIMCNIRIVLICIFISFTLALFTYFFGGQTVVSILFLIYNIMLWILILYINKDNIETYLYQQHYEYKLNAFFYRYMLIIVGTFILNLLILSIRNLDSSSIWYFCYTVQILGDQFMDDYIVLMENGGSSNNTGNGSGFSSGSGGVGGPNGQSSFWGGGRIPGIRTYMQCYEIQNIMLVQNDYNVGHMIDTPMRNDNYWELHTNNGSLRGYNPLINRLLAGNPNYVFSNDHNVMPRMSQTHPDINKFPNTFIRSTPIVFNDIKRGMLHANF